jgi:hypothetical protein
MLADVACAAGCECVVDPRRCTSSTSQGRERFLADPMVDHTASGSYLPTNRLASWGLGIALVARYLAA